MKSKPTKQNNAKKLAIDYKSLPLAIENTEAMPGIKKKHDIKIISQNKKVH